LSWARQWLAAQRRSRVAVRLPTLCYGEIAQADIADTR
jgi:hypothetical protein